MPRLPSRRWTIVVSAALATTTLIVVAFWHGSAPKDESWKSHPALDDSTWRAQDEMDVTAGVSDPRIIAEISRRYRLHREEKHFERLVQYYWHDEPRLRGMTRAQVEAIFGSEEDRGSYCWIDGGRDGLQIWYQDGRVVDAFHVIGF